MNSQCEKCNQIITEKYGSGRFCGSKCARSYATSNSREEISKKTSKALVGKQSKNRDSAWLGIDTKEKQCPMCDTKFIVSYHQRHRTFCSKNCFHSFTYNEKNPNFAAMIESARNAGKKSAARQSETRRSKNEMLFFELCSSKFEDCRNNSEIVDGWDADVVIPSKKIAVMWNGQWHYYPIAGDAYLKKVKKRDNIKLNCFKRAGYNVYVIEDHGKHNEKFVKEKFERFLVWANSI